ncbi:amidohydrolase family protein [Algoriphagus zhangzhouensis]|uniref:Amidohydrolase-related domain-containing protein n=1 Tax=Algoriphagus zhangzhouensis TaxID=1073327 RepID=A0A1M7Z7D0_9BACT|nr:amidohydrolase family protein [Algoriphagus zhangzhouensis]TDY49313.1 hypothetical protein A8938_1005 [Algoriphagus zhangzhouensis]SHO60754.1 hypothetical protein SAMN04488108_1005 [Algoriphagus zhangzhouensis]
MLIIDSHCHAGKGDGLTGPWDTNAPLKDYLKWCDRSQITKSVLFAAFHSNYAIANREVAKIVNSNPQRFYGFAFVHASRDTGRIFDLVKIAVNEYGFKGIKVHRADSQLSREICQVARYFRLPILYDPMGDIGGTECAISEYPDVNFIIPHLGSFADDWKAQKNCIGLLERYPNAFADTSGIRRFDVLQEAVQRAGSSKFLFGSDGPWLHPGVELYKVKALEISRKDKESILSKNFLKLISNSNSKIKSCSCQTCKNYVIKGESKDELRISRDINSDPRYLNNAPFQSMFDNTKSNPYPLL